MAGMFKNVFGSEPSAPAKSEDDFADFVKVPAPSPASIVAASSTPAVGASGDGDSPVLYTKWYRVWERTSPRDFLQEATILPFIIVLLAFHVWGTRKNRSKAREWAKAHAGPLQNEFAIVGFGGVKPTVNTKGGFGAPGVIDPDLLFKEISAQEFTTYASGRQNVAFVDVAIKLPKRYNPIIYFGDYIGSMFSDNWEAPSDRFEATAYAFDGKEKDLVPVPAKDTSELKVANSAYDGFIFAVVHKGHMRKLRQDRYDASLTFTKEHPKLPNWVTVMTESAEITDVVLTQELIGAIELAGNALEYLIVTDQPIDKPEKIEETVPRKRVQLSINMSAASHGYANTMPLFVQFLRLMDRLVASAHFRPEVMRKVRNTREEEIKRLRRLDEEEKAEERKLTADKIKKEQRERVLRGMSADEQRKYLEREREKEQRKSMKKYSKKA